MLPILLLHVNFKTVAIMKKMKSLAMAICVLGVAFVSLQGCSQFNLEREEGTGTISMSINGIDAAMYSEGAMLKSEVPVDTNSFILTVKSSAGTVIYDGIYGERPQELAVSAGEYIVSIVSTNFTPPMFDAPQFGDTQQITVEQGVNTQVHFSCKQLNAGLRLKFTDEFKAKFPGTGVFIKQGDNSVEYRYDQTKFLYLKTSIFSMIYSKSDGDTVLMTKALSAGQMATMTLSYKNTLISATTFGVQVDTTRDWIDFDYNVARNIPAGVYTIPEAVKRTGEKIQVFGYIIGGDPSTNSFRIGPPFTSNSSIVIATSMTERDRTRMMVVELPSGDLRDALNLVDHPHLVGNPIIITGTVADFYYGYLGIKGTNSFTML